MTNTDYRHYVLIVDRSGSMDSIKTEAQQGINSFIKEQAKLPGKATLSMYQFDNVHDTVHDFTPLKKVRNYTMVPRNMTALLDACGFAITQVGEKLAALPEDERPDKVIVLITTDGLENCSREYSRTQIKELITQQQEKYGWQFSFVGANQDAFTEATNIGIPLDSALTFAATGSGTQSSYASASSASTRYVSGQSVNLSYTDDERKAAEDK